METTSVRLRVVHLWGLAGVLALLVNAIVRLGAKVKAPIDAGLFGTFEWVVLVVTVVAFAYMEGVRGFHNAFAPRVAARALHLESRPIHEKLLAPMFLMGLIGATKKRKIVSWCLVTGIVLLVLAVGQLGPVWRGIVDAGVVSGLSVGVLSIFYWWVQGFSGKPLPKDPDLPLKAA